MPKKRRRGKIPTPAWESASRGAIGSRVLGRGFQFYGAVFVAFLVALGLGIVAYAFWQDEAEKRGRPGSTAIQVDETSFRLDYFASRLGTYMRENGGFGVVQPETALVDVSDLIISEEIIRRFADDEGVTATEDEIREAIAEDVGIASDDESFDLVVEQQLERRGLSETQYRDLIEASVLRDKLVEHFLADVPDTAESVRYRQIIVGTEEAAQEIEDQLLDGADFAVLAQENSLDPATREIGGDVGWVPRGALDASTEELLFALDPGQIATIPTHQGVLVVEMQEKDDSHPVEDSQKQTLAAAALEDWVDDHTQSVSIVNNMGASGDNEKRSWAVQRAAQS